MTKRQASRQGLPAPAKKVIENNLRQSTQPTSRQHSSSPQPQEQQQQQQRFSHHQEVPGNQSPPAVGATSGVNGNHTLPTPLDRGYDQPKKSSFWRKLTCGICQ
jgi:casein kinase 1